jgi:hypothetical protein
LKTQVVLEMRFWIGSGNPKRVYEWINESPKLF